MSWWKSGPRSVDGKDKPWTERRKEPRIGGQFKVRYSGSKADKIVMGHATIIDLSRYGFGLQGARGLQPGMELALFVQVADLDAPLCIPEAIVSWVKGHRFGVELQTARGKDPEWLQYLSAE
jgi:hypothetical protein